MNRSSSRRTDTTRRIRPLWLGLLALLCGWAFMACAGGSGSSGFDLALKAENDAIDRALGADDCQVNDGLTIYLSPADDNPDDDFTTNRFAKLPSVAEKVPGDCE